MDDTITKLRLLARAELTVAHMHAQRLARRAKLYAVAIGLILLTIVMVNVGAYKLIAESVGDANSAFLIAIGDGLLAVIIFLVASRVRPGAEEDMAREIRELVLRDVTADANQIKEGISGLAGFGPLVSLLVDMLKGRKK